MSKGFQTHPLRWARHSGRRVFCQVLWFATRSIRIPHCQRAFLNLSVPLVGHFLMTLQTNERICLQVTEDASFERAMLELVETQKEMEPRPCKWLTPMLIHSAGIICAAHALVTCLGSACSQPGIPLSTLSSFLFGLEQTTLISSLAAAAPSCQ